MEQNLKEKNKQAKKKLIMESVPGHPINNEDKADNTEEFLKPPNMTSLLQPLDKGVLVPHKAYYLRWGV
jgi:hypothetical protein